MYRTDRIGRRGGGVILYVKESIQAYEIKLERELSKIRKGALATPGVLYKMRS